MLLKGAPVLPCLFLLSQTRQGVGEGAQVHDTACHPTIGKSESCAEFRRLVSISGAVAPRLRNRVMEHGNTRINYLGFT